MCKPAQSFAARLVSAASATQTLPRSKLHVPVSAPADEPSGAPRRVYAAPYHRGEYAQMRA